MTQRIHAVKRNITREMVLVAEKEGKDVQWVRERLAEGTLVTDIAPGYDHITAAIGGTVAAASGADFLCYVAPAEHLGLPDHEDVREGVIASKIAAHAADLVKGVKGAWERDLETAKARKALDWEKQIALSIDPVRSRKVREQKNPSSIGECTMCGSYCAMKVVSRYLGDGVKEWTK